MIGPTHGLIRAWAWIVHRRHLREIPLAHRPNESQLIAWAKAQSEDVLRQYRGIGSATIAWLRARTANVGDPLWGQPE